MFWSWSRTTWTTTWNNTAIDMVVCCRIHLFLTPWATMVISWTRQVPSTSNIRWSSCRILIVTSWRLGVSRWMNGLVVVWVSTCILSWEFTCFCVNSGSIISSSCHMRISCIILMVCYTISCWTTTLRSSSISIFRDKIVVTWRISSTIQLLLIS